MSKVRLVKIWLCVGVLLAFLSGGAVSWMLNQTLRPLQALPSHPEASEDWRDRIIRELGLDEDQVRDLDRILENWQRDRMDLQAQFQPKFKEINTVYEQQILEEVYTPEQRDRYFEMIGN